MMLTWDKSKASRTVRILGSILMLESFIILFISIDNFTDLAVAAGLFVFGRLGIVLTGTDFWNDLFEKRNKQVYKIRKVRGK